MNAPDPVPRHGSGQLAELLQDTFPIMLMVQTTSACNSSCVFCPHRLYRDRVPQGRMSPELFRRIMTETGGHPETVCINLFLMNEPLMDPEIVPRIGLAQRLNPQAHISLWTNGVALHPRRTRQLLDSPLCSLGISLHAHHAATYRRLTGRDDFRRVLRNVVHLVEQRNARRPDLTLALRYVSAGAMPPREREELTRFWRDAAVVLDIDEGYLSRAGALPAPGAPSPPHRWMSGCVALGGPKQAHVLFDGRVVLCCMDYAQTTCLGDLSRETLADVWTGPRRRRHLETLYGARPADPETFLCSRCELALPARAEDARGDQRRQHRPPDDPVWAAV